MPILGHLNDCMGTGYIPLCRTSGVGEACIEDPPKMCPTEVAPDCGEHGVCVNNDSVAESVCSDDYMGDTCEIPPTTDPCNPNPCQNSGTCADNGGIAECTCVDGYTGDTCQIPPEPECTIPGDCDDDNLCTTDDCVDDACIYVNNDDPCDDLDACTVGDTCSDGACSSGDSWDDDGDGYLNEGCGGDDCDDSEPDVYPGAAELCDFVDNQCPGDEGYGMEDEVKLCNKKVFLTESTFTGNLGGVMGADAKCQAEAARASLPGEFRAWISDGVSSPQQDWPALVDGGPFLYYVLVDRDIASSLIALTLDSLFVDMSQLWYPFLYINIDQFGVWHNELGDKVWTGVTDYEEPWACSCGDSRHDNCNGWTDESADGVFRGGWGEPIWSPYHMEEWTEIPYDDPWEVPGVCSESNHLYCFEM